MSLHEASATLSPEVVGDSVILVLDASESASSCQQRIDTLAREVIQRAHVNRIYFLGNPVSYPANRFATQSSAWFQENRLRASLLMPLFTELSKEKTARLVVVGSGVIYDLEDVRVHLPNLLLVNVGASLQIPPELVQEIHNPDAQNLLSRVQDPIVRIQITGPGFLPLFWQRSQTADTLDYELKYESGSFVLIGKDLQDYTVRLRYLCDSSQGIQVKVTHRSDARNNIHIKPEPTWTSEEAPLGQLTSAESEIFHRAVSHQSFSCPRCDKVHEWDTLRCKGKILLKPVYDTLRDARGFVLFQGESDPVRYRPLRGSVLRLAEDKAAVMLKPEAPKAATMNNRVAPMGPQIYRFDAAMRRWQHVEEMEPYYHLGDAGYAIAI